MMENNEKWKVIHSSEFNRCIKKLKLRGEDEKFLIENIEKWFQSEQNLLIETPSNKKIIRNIGGCDLFDVHLPSMHSGKKTGKSGGYRLIVIYNKEDRAAELGMIFNRKDLDFKGSRGKESDKRDDYIKELKKKLGG